VLAQLWQIKTDHEGESTIVFKVPSSELINVVKLNTLLLKELKLIITLSGKQKCQEPGDLKSL
jgi:hypothetical protein